MNAKGGSAAPPNNKKARRSDACCGGPEKLLVPRDFPYNEKSASPLKTANASATE